MQIKSISSNNISYYSNIIKQTTCYNNIQTTTTNYYLKNGSKLTTYHFSKNGKKEGILKEFYNGAWELTKSKLIDLTNGTRKIKVKINHSL